MGFAFDVRHGHGNWLSAAPHDSASAAASHAPSSCTKLPRYRQSALGHGLVRAPLYRGDGCLALRYLVDVEAHATANAVPETTN